MAIQPIQNRLFSEQEQRKEQHADSKASKKQQQKFTVQPAAEESSSDTLLEGQMIDSQNVIELLNHKPAEPRNYQKEKLRQAVKNPSQNSSNLNKKL